MLESELLTRQRTRPVTQFCENSRKADVSFALIIGSRQTTRHGRADELYHLMCTFCHSVDNAQGVLRRRLSKD